MQTSGLGFKHPEITKGKSYKMCNVKSLNFISSLTISCMSLNQELERMVPWSKCVT